MTELQEVHGLSDVPSPLQRANPKILVVTFFLGVLCTIVLTVGFLSVFQIHAQISWPAGRIEIGQNAAPRVVHESAAPKSKQP
jgi:hypothetical protein